VLANPTTQIEHNRGRPTKSLMRSAADARETLHTASLAPRGLRATTIPGAYLTSALDVTSMASKRYSFANTRGGKHA
jgi:hypothetical protein